MKYIKLYESYNNNTLYVFDLDETLVSNPSFTKLVVKSINENFNLSKFLMNSLKEINKKIKDIKIQDDRIYIDDINNDIELSKNWTRKKGRVYLLQPDEYEISDLNLPQSTKDLLSKYNSVDNKCIITARPEISKDQVINRLEELGIKKPKYGFHFFPRIKRYGVGTWKGKKIIEICKKNNFNKVIFYDDNRNYLRDAKSIIIKEGSIEITTIKV